jgi:hypothetical protein
MAIILERRKQELIKTFKEKANDVFSDFLQQYDGYVEFLNSIKKKNPEVDDIESMFKTRNDYDLVKESQMRKIERLFTEYCPELNKNLDDFEDRFKKLNKTLTYSFTFQGNVDEDEIAEFVYQHIKVKVKSGAIDEEGEEAEEKEAEEMSPRNNPSASENDEKS